MNNTPLVSICIATYNGADYLRETLASIEAQTYSRIEVLICDDWSSDSSVDLTREWSRSARLPVTLIESTENFGPGSTFEKGISASSGEYFMMFSQDDLMYPHHVESVVQNALAEPRAVVVPSRLVNIAWKPALGGTSPSEVWRFFFGLILRNQIAAPGTLVKRSAWRPEFLGVTNFLTQDQEMWLNLALTGPVATQAGGVFYRVHSSNLHRSQSEIARQLDVGLMFNRLFGGKPLKHALDRQDSQVRVTIQRQLELNFMSMSWGSPLIRVLNEEYFDTCRHAVNQLPSAAVWREIAAAIKNDLEGQVGWSVAQRSASIQRIASVVAEDAQLEIGSVVPLVRRVGDPPEDSPNTGHRSFASQVHIARGLVKRRALFSRLTRLVRYKLRLTLSMLRPINAASHPWPHDRQERQ